MNFQVSHETFVSAMFIAKLQMKKSAQRDANTARVLAVVRFGHRLPARYHKPTDRTNYNTLCSS